MLKQKHNLSHIISGIVISFVIFVTFNLLISLLSSSTFALTYGSSTVLEYTFLPSLTVSFTPNTGFIIDNLNAGNSAYSNTVTVSVSSNASDGYVLAATVGSTSDNNRNNNKLVHSNNTNAFDSIAINANLALNNLGNDKWGYATYDTTNENWSNYNGLATVGSTGTTLLSTNNADAKTLDMRIGASATLSQVSGTYTNNINFITTANVITYDYSVSYNANAGSDTVNGMPSNATGSFNTGEALKTSSNIPTRGYYTFLGWCSGTVNNTDCNGDLYQANDYIKIANAVNNSGGGSNSVVLNAVWSNYMQDFKSTACQSLGSTEITLYDKRDEQAYTVQKMSDGKCWMTKNLNLAGGTEIEYTKSDVPENHTLSTSQGFQSGNRLPASSASGFDDSTPDIAFLYNSGSSTCGDNSPCYSYYSWITATAGGKAADGSAITTNNTDAPYSICPKHWRLPTTRDYDDDTSDYRLISTLLGGSATVRIYNGSTTPTGSTMFSDLTTTYKFIQSGWYSGGAFSRGGLDGVFWSATSSGSVKARDLFFHATYVDFSNYNYRSRGRAVRCIFKG